MACACVPRRSRLAVGMVPAKTSGIAIPRLTFLQQHCKMNAMTTRTDLEPHFAGTFHVTHEVGLTINGYWSEAYQCWIQPARFLAGIGEGGRPILIDTEADLLQEVES